MSEAVLFSAPQDSSPRSTIFNASSMTTALPVMNEATTLTSDDVSGKVVKDSSPLDHHHPHHHPKAPEVHKVYEQEAHFSAPPTPISSHPDYTTYLHYSNPTPTSQAGGSQGGGGGGYYMGYLPPQMIPEPDSPSRLPYDNFFHSAGGAAFHPPPPFRYGPKTPPARGMTAAANLTPSSPVLFPRVSASYAPPGAPSLPYTTSFPGSEAQVYLGAVSNSSDEGVTWSGPSGDSRNPNSYSHSATAQGMQQMHYGGMTVTRATSGGRAYSFEGDTMLPPSALVDDAANPAYSPYASAASPNSGFASWGGGYGNDPYGSPTSPLQPRPTIQMGMIPPSPIPGGGGMRLYGTNYAATSPGLPIQTTASNKGPDGANLFIFHIPNHYTNLDMYHLFLPYGNLLSVRIMVERETGRSRGFGFVSYDTPEAAAMAIKELNGYPIGNKRLKVQHKQIRRNDLHDSDPDGFGGDFATNAVGGGYPPSGPNSNLWFDTTQNPIDLREEGTPEAEESGVDAKLVEAADPSLDFVKSLDDPVVEEPIVSSTSPLATLGQLQDSLPSIEGNVGEEKTEVSPPTVEE